MCYFQPLNFQTPVAASWLHSSEAVWMKMSHIREHFISGLLSLWCYLQAILHMHLPLLPLVPNLLSIALLSCCIWQGVTWLISECPFSVLPLEFNILWGQPWYKQKHETLFGPSHTASINWLTPPVLLCREVLNSLSFCPLFVSHGGGEDAELRIVPWGHPNYSHI